MRVRVAYRVHSSVTTAELSAGVRSASVDDTQVVETLIAPRRCRVTSQIAWVDHDDSQRRRMLAVIELFKEEGTVDELGIGAIRDAIADILFPGTSVLHTRTRYLLFIPCGP